MSDRINDFIEEKTGIDTGLSDSEILVNGYLATLGATATYLTYYLTYSLYSNYVGFSDTLSASDPRERMANQLLMRGHATMDEILQASYGEWPPKGLDIVSDNSQQVNFGNIIERASDNPARTWLGRMSQRISVMEGTFGDASLHGDRTIRMNHLRLSSLPGLIGRSAYNSTLGHEGIHILQGDNYYRTLEIYGNNNAYAIWNQQQMVLGDNDRAALVFDEHMDQDYVSKLSKSNLEHFDYVRSGIETQARIHEIMISGYQDWGRLPSNREEFLVAMHNSGLEIPDTIMEEVKSSPTYTETQKVFAATSPAKQSPVEAINFVQKGLTEEGRLAYWNNAMPELYVDLIEMYGDGPGRARFDMGVNIRPELRAQINPEQPPKPPPTQWIYDHSDNPDLREAVERLVEEQHYDARIRFLARGGDPNDFRFDKEGKINGLINQYKGVQDVGRAIDEIYQEGAQLIDNRVLLESYVDSYKTYYGRVSDTLGTNPNDLDMANLYERYLWALEDGGEKIVNIHMETYNNISNDDIANYAQAYEDKPITYARNRLTSQTGNSLISDINEAFDRLNEGRIETERIPHVERSSLSQYDIFKAVVQDLMVERQQLAQERYELKHGNLEGFEFDVDAKVDRVMHRYRRDDNLTDVIDEYRDAYVDTAEKRILLSEYGEAYTRYQNMVTDVTGADPREVRGTAILSGFDRTLEHDGIDKIQEFIDGYNNVSEADMRLYVQAQIAIENDDGYRAHPNSIRGSIWGHEGDEILAEIDSTLAEYNRRFPDREPLLRHNPEIASPEVENTQVKADTVQEAPRVSGMADEAVQSAADMARAADALQAGARAARMAKVGVVTTVAATAAGVALTERAHAAQQDLAEQYAAGGNLINRMPGETDEAFATRTEEALQAYLEINTNVRDVVITETTVNQTPIVGVVIGMAATEAYAQEQFSQWCEQYGPIDEEVFQALKMDMLGGQSMKAEFAMAGRDMIPDTMSEFPASLHALWEAKQNLEYADSQADGRLGRSRDSERQATMQEAHAERQEALEVAEAAYQEEFDRALSDPETANELLSLMPQDLLMEMLTQTAGNSVGEQHPAIQRLVEVQNELEEMSSSRAKNEDRAELREELEQIHAEIRQNPDILHDYIRTTFGGNPDSATVQPTATADIGSRFADMSDVERTAIIADLTQTAMNSEELKAAHPYIRELADLTARHNQLEAILTGSRRINQSNKVRMERQSGEIEERLETVRAELLEHPEIIDAAAHESDIINEILGEEKETEIQQQPELIAETSIPDGPFDGIAGDRTILEEAQMAGVNFDPALIPQDQSMQATATNNIGLSHPQA